MFFKFPQGRRSSNVPNIGITRVLNGVSRKSMKILVVAEES